MKSFGEQSFCKIKDGMQLLCTVYRMQTSKKQRKTSSSIKLAVSKPNFFRINNIINMIQAERKKTTGFGYSLLMQSKPNLLNYLFLLSIQACNAGVSANNSGLKLEIVEITLDDFLHKSLIKS